MPMPIADLDAVLAHADRRTLAAVVTHLAQDPGAVPDLRDRAQIEAKAREVLPPYLSGEKVPTPPNDEVLQAAMDLAVGAEVPAASVSPPPTRRTCSSSTTGTAATATG
jgi:hypothetical protein